MQNCRKKNQDSLKKYLKAIAVICTGFEQN